MSKELKTEKHKAREIESSQTKNGSSPEELFALKSARKRMKDKKHKKRHPEGGKGL